jgi:hypothetical protein
VTGSIPFCPEKFKDFLFFLSLPPLNLLFHHPSNGYKRTTYETFFYTLDLSAFPGKTSCKRTQEKVSYQAKESKTFPGFTFARQQQPARSRR